MFSMLILFDLFSSKFFSNSRNLFQTDSNSTIVDQLFTKYCNDPSTLPNARVICCTNPKVIAPDTIVGARARYGTITIP